MKAPVVVAVLTLLFILSVSAQERQVYLKLENGDPYVSVFKKPGLNWKYCQKNSKGECVDAMGWLDGDAKVWIAGPKVKVATPDPFTNEMVEEEYYPVRFEYSRKAQDKNGREIIVHRAKGPIGYIDAAYVDFEKRAPLYSGVKDSSAGNGKSCSLASSSGIGKIDDIKCALEMKNIQEASRLLKDRIGFCADLKEDKNKKANLYDNVILKKMKGMDAPKIKGEDDRYMTKDQLIDIDALARTLYGEMASCYKHGLHYPMAVARIAMNRSEDKGRRKSFIQGQHQSGKPLLSRVVTTATQFSIWLRKLNGKANPPLGMALCPPRDSSQKMWNGRKPSKEELVIWEHTVQIATEAILFPESFKRRTQNLDDRYFYTSGMGHFYKMKKDTVKIEGRLLDKSKCIEIWNHQKS